MQSNQQNSGVPKKKEAEKFEFEKFTNSNSLVVWTKNFKREVCYSSSFPEALAMTFDIGAARNMDE